jgi:hypothetical protein
MNAIERAGHTLGATWEKIDGWPYWISDTGKVWSQHTDKILAPYPNEGGEYLVVDLRKQGARKQKYIHRAVLEAFTEPEPGKEAHHVDGDSYNNTLANLEWRTPAQNVEEQQDQTAGDLGRKEEAVF